EKLGPIEAIIHASGLLRDARIEKKSAQAMKEVLQTKVDGLINLIRGTLGDPIKVVAAWSSWSARFGNIGQIDYAAANELVNRLCGEVERLHPEARAVSIMWSPWEDSDMARSIPPIVRQGLEAEGVLFVPTKEGMERFVGELLGGRGEVLIGLEMPLEERTLLSRQTLSLESHPMLSDHRLKDKAILPFASVIEDMLEASRGLRGDAVVAVHGVELCHGIQIDPSVELMLEARSRRFSHSPECGHIELNARHADEQPKLAYRAQLLTDAELPEPIALQGEVLGLPMSIQTYYEEHAFHGPLMQSVSRVLELGTNHIIGLLKPSKPASWSSLEKRSSWLADPLLLDGAFQLVSYWLWALHQVTAFPTRVEHYVQWGSVPTGPVRCVIAGRDEGDGVFSGNIDFYDEHEQRYAAMRGVRAQVFSRAEKASASSTSSSAEIPPERYRMEQFEEVTSLLQRFEMAEKAGLRNPFFVQHHGVARDTSVVAGREMINFSSYNYLGFSGDPEVSAQAKEAIDHYGTSVSASRVASGERPFHTELEAELAQLHGVDASLVFTAGFMTNESVIGHVIGEGDLIVHDALAHSSILQGAVMSGAKRRPFPHNDVKALDAMLSQIRGNFRRCCIAIEGVYSMDGDIAELPGFMALREKHKCLLFVDEAHSIGVLGANGRGISEHFGVDPTGVDFWMGTLSKAFASCGGYIAASRPVVEYLRYTTPALVFSAGMSPANAAAALASVRKMREEPQRVQQLQQRARFFLERARTAGIDVGMSDGSAVVPCIVGHSMKCLSLSERLAQRGINVQPIVYPAVEDSASRLRFFISSLHSEEQLGFTVDALAEELRTLA
ncbi:MAG: aminotransferase class I/II-fold pyridoxal phosphate-dependent enzyme, partial [Myxococcota bacterium]|nr:aminotransferase class I/II-fold pyridoxal phosphate-dependent enzyme [Myxococcota bacterium]